MFESEIPMQSRRVMFLNDKRGFGGSGVFRSFEGDRLGGFASVAHGPVFLKPVDCLWPFLDWLLQAQITDGVDSSFDPRYHFMEFELAQFGVRNLIPRSWGGNGGPSPAAE